MLKAPKKVLVAGDVVDVTLHFGSGHHQRVIVAVEKQEASYQ